MASVERNHAVNIVSLAAGGAAAVLAIFVTCARTNDQQIAVNTSKLIRIESIDLPELRHRTEVQTARIDALEQRCEGQRKAEGVGIEAMGSKP